jgi:hypothetical protein
MRGVVWAACAAAGLATVAWASAASAAPGLKSKVETPYVESGVTEVELRGGRFTSGDAEGESGAAIEIEHGVNDRLSLAVVGEFEDEAGERRRLESVGVEARGYLGQVPGLGLDVGGYLEYEQRVHAESGVLEGKLLLARQFGPVETLLNLIAEQPLTGKSGQGATEFGYAAEASAPVRDNVRLGVQAFGDLGTNRAFGASQPHFIGPMARWTLHPSHAVGELELEASYLFAAGAARHDTDGQVRFALEWEKRF